MEQSEVGYSNLLMTLEAISAVVLSGSSAVLSGRSTWRRSFMAWSFFAVLLTQTLICHRTSSTSSPWWSVFIFVTLCLTGGRERVKFKTEFNCTPDSHAGSKRVPLCMPLPDLAMSWMLLWTHMGSWSHTSSLCMIFPGNAPCLWLVWVHYLVMDVPYVRYHKPQLCDSRLKGWLSTGRHSPTVRI